MTATSQPALLSTAAERALAYLDGLDARGVAPTPEALQGLQKLDAALGERGEDPSSVLALLV